VVIDLIPGALVTGLFLAPDKFPGIGIAIELLAQALAGKGIELLDSNYGDIVPFVLAPSFEQVEVHLAAAGDDAFDLIVLVWIDLRNQGLELTLGQRIQSLRKPLVFVGKALVVVIGLQFVLGWAAWISIMLGVGKGPVVSAAEAGIVPTPPLAQTVLTTAHQANGAVLMGLTAAAFAWGRKLSPKPRKS